MKSVVEKNEVSSVVAPDAVTALRQPREFTRDRLTWMGYLLYGYWSYLWAAFGAFNPYLRSEFQIDYSTAALHFSALSLGPFISGFFSDKLIGALGLTKTMWVGLVLMLTGLMLVVTGRQIGFTICGALLIGYGGNIMSQSTVTSMSERFGNHRAIGISEIQTIGSVFTLLAPLTVTAVVKAGFDFRCALVASFGVFAAWFACNWRTLGSFATKPDAFSSATHDFAAGQTAVPTATGESAGKGTAAPSRTKLPPKYWFFFFVIFLSVASEWSVAFWSTEFVASRFAVSNGDAALCMSVFVAAMLTGRICGTRLVRMLPETLFLTVSAVLAAGGFLLFWLGGDLPISLVGLCLMGLGEANVYPLCLSRALASAPHVTEKAAARMSLSTGGSILIAPMCLGLLADKFGISNAYALIAVSLIAAAIAICFVSKVSDSSRTK